MEQRKEDGLAWNGQRGSAWVDLQPMLDRLFGPLQQILADTVMAASPHRVLDIGCGTGATTRAIANRLAPLGACTGIDLSEAMLAHARQQAIAEGTTNARFLAGDAQRRSFATASFDAVMSRFGVMFFDDPEAAFANIRNAVRPGGTLTCLVWRSPEENPFMTAAERATGPLLGWNDAPDPDAPGQFAFADAGRVTRILTAAGWQGIDIRPVDVRCTLSEPDLRAYSHRMGRVGLILHELDPALHARVTVALDAAFAEFQVADSVEFDAACWMVRAQAS